MTGMRSIALGAFQLLEPVGQGGMGQVWRGVHTAHGLPVAILPVILVVEIISMLARPFALAIRLFANMTAGHVVIVSLISLIFVLKSVFVAGMSVPFALFVYTLEILVAFLQAFIFTMLSSLFIGLAVHPSH